MPKPLSKEWIEEQLAVCEKAEPGPWTESVLNPTMSFVRDRDHWHMGALFSPEDARFIATAREGYPLVLQALKKCQQETDDGL